MTETMRIIGDYPFMVATAAYNDLKHSSAWRWKSQGRIGRKPALQYVGPEAHKIQISGVILPNFKGGFKQLDFMRAEADRGQPLLMVDGRGFIWGSYVITSISESQSHFYANGAPKHIGFDMSLIEYGDDNAAQSPILSFSDVARAAVQSLL